MASLSHEHIAGHTAEPIAIVGVGCKLPGNLSSLAELFAALRDARDCITEVPPDRWDSTAYYDPDPLAPGKSYVRRGGFMTDIDRFDAGFFDISSAEAPRMDPQQRVVLEAVWHALEDAGQSGDELAQTNTGVFLAMMNTNDYSQLKRHFEGLPGITPYDAMGDAMSITAGRIAHFLSLEGPCLALDTACSGSMVALHLARQSILAGDCDSAIVAGVSAILHPGVNIAFSKVGLMSRVGRCSAFDERADGYVRSEGCLAVLVRRQSAAIARGDRILASIVGSAVNQDGRTPAVTAPNGRAQEKVIRMALSRAGISPNEIGYVEAHGTGTPVGDPIEMSALANVYGPGRPADESLFIGSAKSNFGHIEAGAGLLGVVKAALSLHQEQILPSLHFQRLNPSIDLGQAPIRVASTTIPWPRGRQPRLAGVNAFGYSGTNAHLILQEAPLPGESQAPAAGAGSLPARPNELVLLSAKSPASLQELVDRWTTFLEHNDPLLLQDIAFTAATGRSHFRHRLAAIGRSREEVSQKLRAWREGRPPRGLEAGQTPFRKPKIAFAFTGQGSQYAGMGRQIYDLEPRFKAAIDRCAALMDPGLESPLLELLFGSSSAALLANTRNAQPALFAIEYALADLFHSWAVEPDYVIGHSVGEIVAACVGGVLSLEDAARFVIARGRLMGELPPGGKMLAVNATAEQVGEWIADKLADVSIAAVNGPRAVVVSGRAAGVEAVAQLAQAAGCRGRELEVSHAFHSPLMDPILDELSAVAASLRISPARLPIFSNVTGEQVPDDLSPAYWSSHVRQPVLFYNGMSSIVEAGCSVLVEVGPHPALIPAIASAFDRVTMRAVSTLMRDQQDNLHLTEALASLYVSGVPLDLDRLFWSPAYRRVSLPLYPFRRDRHWLKAEQTFEQPLELKAELHGLLGRAVSVGARRVVFEVNLAATQPWTDHRVLGSTVFPGSAYLEMAARGFAAASGRDWRSVVLRDVAFERPLMLTYRKPKQVTLTLDEVSVEGSGAASFVIAAAEDGHLESYCRGRIAAASEELERASLETTLGPREARLETGPFYGELRKRGLEYGASFATVRELWQGAAGAGEAIGRVTTSPFGDEAERGPFTNAVLLDGCLQIFGAALATVDGESQRGAFVPAAVQSVTLRRELPAQVWSKVSIQPNGDGRAALAQIRVLSDDGEVLAEIDGLELRQKLTLTTVRAEGVSASPESAPGRDGSSSAGSESRDQLLAELRSAPPDQRVGVLTRWLAAEVKDTMGQAAEELDLDNLDPSTAFLEIGLDSLLVTELQRRIQEKLDFRFEPMQGLDYQSIESLAQFILQEVLTFEPAKEVTPAGR